MTDKTQESGVRGEPRTVCLAGVVLLFAHARMSLPRADKDKFHCGWTNRLSSSSANKYPIFWIGSQLTSWYNLSWWSAQLCGNEGLGYITDNLSDYNCLITGVINWDAIAKSPSLWTPWDRIQTVFDGRPIARGFTAVSGSIERQRGLLSGHKEETICLLRPSPECKPCSLQGLRWCCRYCYSSLFIDHQKYIMYWEMVMFMGNIVYV